MAFCGSVQSTNMPIICAGETISWSSSKSRVASASCSKIGTAICRHAARMMNISQKNARQKIRGNTRTTVPDTSASDSRSTNNNTRERNTPNTVSTPDSRPYLATDRPPPDSLKPAACVGLAHPPKPPRADAPFHPKSYPPRRAWRVRRTRALVLFQRLRR